eukprot:CAMPEP_0179071686 /NCGR_PEP_ID=MMETSP0796-20121207/31661_1 /TAXON_ID=73915 /ORGANISM="Pyrodinium bahamense, Strain pbaha01" /LENGTH=146 /DNA_ID=CAMNT_0020768811 /DNA_START=21 /DNA_END=461 /DNA_ORIENTATION=+
MTVVPALVMARRLRSEEELRGVMLSSSTKQIEAACKRATAAGVPTALIEQALAVAAQQPHAGGDDWNAKASRVAGHSGVAWGIARARRLRAEQDLHAAVQAGGTERVAVARRRAEAAGVALADIEAALAKELGTAGRSAGSVAGTA